MTRLINQFRIPYGGAYVLNQPQKGLVGHGISFAQLVRSISEWRRANSFPIGLGFEAEVEQAVCEQYPQECDDSSKPNPRKPRLGFSTVLRGTQVLLSFKLAGSPHVSQEEANQRAEICSKCIWNQEYQKPCGGRCGGLREVVASIVGGNSTPYDDKLKSCGICGCVAKAHIWLPMAFLEKGVTEDMKAQFSAVKQCWKKSV